MVDSLMHDARGHQDNPNLNSQKRFLQNVLRLNSKSVMRHMLRGKCE